jgi:hypothetical protein
MIITGIGTDMYNYYNFHKKIVTKNVYDPINDTYKVEYVQYFYNKVGELEPTKAMGLTIDKQI